jgi:hypothetical protein
MEMKRQATRKREMVRETFFFSLALFQSLTLFFGYLYIVPRYFGNAKRDWKTSRHVAIKILTEADVDNYKLSDVVLPLPGHDIIYPSGPLYEKIKAIMAVDGLDPGSMLRDQR